MRRTIRFTTARGSTLDLEVFARGTGVFLPRSGAEELFPVPQTEKDFAEGPDSEGGKAYGTTVKNSTGSGTVLVSGSDQAEFETYHQQWQSFVAEMDSVGGELEYTPEDGTAVTYQVEEMKITGARYDAVMMRGWVQEFGFEFTCLPYGLLDEVTLFEDEAITGPISTVEAEDVPGHVDALGELVVADAEGTPRDFVSWGLSELFDPADPVLLDSSDLVTSGFMGTVRSGRVVADSVASWGALCGTGEMPHVGRLRVKAIVRTESAGGQMRLSYSVNGGQLSVGRPVAVPDFAVTSDVEIDLGVVNARQVGRGSTHYWSGQVEFVMGDGTLAQEFQLVELRLFPLDRHGVARAPAEFTVPTVIQTSDPFDQSAGNLNGKAIAAAGSVSGPKSPGTVTGNDGGGDPWTNPSNAVSSNDSRATYAKNAFSDLLIATDFGFTLPAGSTVSGIVAEIERRQTGAGSVADTSVYIVKGGSVQTTENKADPAHPSWPTVDTYKAYGNLADLWSQTWAYTDINAANFGIALEVFCFDSGQAEVDHIRITVYYTDPGGQTWSTTGDAADIAVETTGHTAQRTEVSDADINTGRYAVAGTTVFSDVVVGVSCKRSSSTAGASEAVRGGALARYTDANNWLFGGFEFANTASPGVDTAKVIKRVAGTVTTLASVSIEPSTDLRYVWLDVDAFGRYFLWVAQLYPTSPQLLAAGADSALAAGGALDDGKNGFYDAKTGANACTRNYDSFSVWIPGSRKHVVDANSQAAFDHQLSLKYDSASGAWHRINRYTGSRVFLPVGTSRLAIEQDRNDLEGGLPVGDRADSLTATLKARPRVLLLG